MAPEHPSQLLLSPYLGISAICWKSEPTENPLRRPLGPEEGECPRRVGGAGARAMGPPPLLSLSLYVAAAAAQSGSSRFPLLSPFPGTARSSSQLSSALGTHGWWGQKQGIGLGLGS